VFNYCLAKQGQRPDLVGTEGFEAADKVMKSFGMIGFDITTAQRFED